MGSIVIKKQGFYDTRYGKKYKLNKTHCCKVKLWLKAEICRGCCCKEGMMKIASGIKQVSCGAEKPSGKNKGKTTAGKNKGKTSETKKSETTTKSTSTKKKSTKKKKKSTKKHGKSKGKERLGQSKSKGKAAAKSKGRRKA